MTAVITTHVRPLHAHEALASLRAETHSDLEIVVVDDGGAFRATAGELADVRLVVGDALGVGRARNLGLAAARGEFVIFLDDDDVVLPGRIASLLGAARRTGADLCFGVTRRVMVGSAMTLDAVPTHITSSGPVGFRDLLACNPHINSVLARTAALRAIGGFDAGAVHFDDWSAWLRLADRNAMVWSIADVVAEWRLHRHGLSAQVLTVGAMRSHLIALFDRLQPSLSRDNARAVALARQTVMSNEIVTYDDYVRACSGANAAAGPSHSYTV